MSEFTSLHNDNLSDNCQNNNNIEALKKKSAFENVVVNLICFSLFLTFGYIALISIFQTSIIDPSAYGAERILFQLDNIALNIFVLILFFVFLFLIKKHYNFFAKIDLRFLEAVLVIYTITLGFVWIFSVTSVPAADSYNLYETASQAANGNYSSLDGGDFFNSSYYGGHSYYDFYPFQLGFVFISETVYRIFGTQSYMPIQIINVFCVALAYLGIAKITRLLFKRRAAEFFAILLLGGCFQPILFSTFVYGNIIGMCCAVWASYFLIKYFQSSKYFLLLPCGALLVLAATAKYNNMIYLVAFVVMLIVHTVKEKKWQSIAFALAICIAAVGVNNLIITSYENRAGVRLADGVSQVLYLDMGLNDSVMAPGWYSEIAIDTYLQCELNGEQADEQAWEDIGWRLQVFANDSAYAADFFIKKVTSQWNEPTFESIWVSEVKQHSSELNAVGESMYEGGLGQFFEAYFNLFMQILYILFVIGIYCLFFKRKTNIETALLPLVVLGGFAYHLLFEGKSQYILTYIILLIPTASFGLNTLLDFEFTGLQNFARKFKNTKNTSDTK